MLRGRGGLVLPDSQGPRVMASVRGPKRWTLPSSPSTTWGLRQVLVTIRRSRSCALGHGLNTNTGVRDVQTESDPWNIHGQVWEVATLARDGSSLTLRPSEGEVQVKQYLRPGDPAPDFRAKRLNGETIDLRQASAALGKNADPRAKEALANNLRRQVDALIPSLAERDLRKRTDTLKRLRELGPDAAPLLLDHLGLVRSDVRNAIVGVLGQMKSPAVLPGLIERVGHSRLERSQRFAYESIMRTMRDESRHAVNDLVRLLSMLWAGSRIVEPPR